MALSLTRGTPDALLAVALTTVAEQDPALQRRMVILALLWEQGRQTQAGLMARTRFRLGRGCFGRQPELAFRRDTQFIKKILTRAGYRLQYSRRAHQAGYHIAGQGTRPDQQARAIEGAARELDPTQIAAWARLTPAARLNLVNTLTRDLLALTIQAQRRARPEQTSIEAQREVLHRYYQTAAL